MEASEARPEVVALRQQIEQAHQKAKGSLFTLFINETIVVEDDRLKMVYYLMERLNQKQKANFEQPPSKQPFNPFLNPKGLLIKEMGDGHRLLFNKFNIYKDHLLVVTRQFESQNEAVSHGDMVNAGLACEALNGIVFFNGGQLSGASQKHKHLQILPKKAKQLPILKSIYEFVSSKKQVQFEQILLFPHFNFVHGLIILNPDEKGPLGQQLYEAYKLLYSKLVLSNGANQRCYNLICSQRFVLLVLRSKQNAFNEVSVNSLGYMGSLLFRNKQLMGRYISQHTPSTILEDISWRQL